MQKIIKIFFLFFSVNYSIHVQAAAPPVKTGTPKSKRLFGLPLQSIPKKQKIRAYKTVEHDQKWTVVITDDNDNKISQSTFKKDTDRFASSLYVRLNKKQVPSNDPNSKYNKNHISVYNKKNIQIGNTDTITSDTFKPGYQIKIDTQGPKLVDQQGNMIIAETY